MSRGFEVQDRKAVRRRIFHQWVGLSSILLVIDQATKALVRASVMPGIRNPIINDIVFITYVPNCRGFSWFVPEMPEWVQILFLIVRVLILLMAFPLFDYYTHRKPESTWPKIALIMITAGVVGNLVDDLFVGCTTDFIQVLRSPSANLADLYSYVGIAALAIELGGWWKREKARWRGSRHFLSQVIQSRRDFLSFLRGYFIRE